MMPFVGALAQPASRPFVAPSGDGSAMRFTAMAAEQTGVRIENAFADAQMWWDRYLEFTVGAIGSGVAIGDFDNDGRPDLFVASKTEQSRLFRNLGDWRFEDVTERAGFAVAGSWLAQGATWASGLFGGRKDADEPPERDDVSGWNNGVAWADVNNDGWLDLMLCRFNQPNQLWMNQGDGTFVERAREAGLGLTDASGMAALADYDRDGWLDVFVQTNLFNAAAAPQGQPDRLYRNDGDGTFTDVSDRAGLTGVTQGHAAIWWDYDEDGWPDLYVANDFSAPDQLWHNQGDGTFENRLEAVVPHTPFSAMGADLGDINNDGRIDLFVADMAATSWAKDHRGMADSRAKVDPAVDDDPAPQTLRNALYLNTGTGRMAEAAHLAGLAATDWTWSPRFEDLDNDGWLDLHVTNGMVRELHNADLLARTMVTESPAQRIRLMKASPVLAEANLAYRNRGDMTFAEVGAPWRLDQQGVSFASAFGDLDGDGDLDLLFSNYRGDVSLLRNDSPGGGRITFALRGEVSNRFGVGARIEIETDTGRQVRELVLARGYMATSEPVLHFGLGEATRVRRATVRWPSGRVQVLDDLATGRAYTLHESEATAEPASPPLPVPWYREHAAEVGLASSVANPAVNETTVQPLLTRRHHRAGPRLGSGDFNHDGRLDLVVGGTTEMPARVWFGREHGFQALPLAEGEMARETNDAAVLVIDADADGDDDVLITRGGAALPAGSAAYQPQLWLNRGTGFGPASGLPSWHESTATAVAADFDRDGYQDVFLAARLRPGAYPTPAPKTLWFGGASGFAIRPAMEQQLVARAELVTAAAVVDVESDGWPDLVTVADWGEVVVWHNHGGHTLEPQPLGEGRARGWWRSVAAADFNGDGRADFAVGNLGTNTEYRAPAIAYYGNFGGRRGPSFIEAVLESGVERPRASLKTLSLALPHVARRFRSFDTYAQASLVDLLGAAGLERALRFEANELRSGVWLSDGDGAWRFVPFGPEAQLAPIGAIAVADANGDGHADLFLGQNDFSPVPRVGRFDGGLSGLWLGDGAGGFAFMDWSRSGIVVSGAVRDVLALDFDGDDKLEWFVSREQAPLLLFGRP